MTSQGQIRSQDVSEQLEATSLALLAAHDAHVREATDSVRWERRGWLGRLTRLDRAPDRA
jgi:hypothetical protein